MDFRYSIDKLGNKHVSSLQQYDGDAPGVVMAIVFHATLNVLHANANKRQRRYLLFTKGTQWGVFATISVPLEPPESTVSMAWFFEANYYAVDNSTYLEPLLGDIEAPNLRKKRSSTSNNFLTRRYFYTIIESMLANHSYHGRPCLLRAICESGTSHFLHNGVLGDILHLILTPSTTMEEDDLEDCYYEAEYRGLVNDCDHYDNICPLSPLHYISVYTFVAAWRQMMREIKQCARSMQQKSTE